jgi:N utilization substance protein A
MIRIKYDMDLMNYISLFETVTQAKLKDCILGERLLFIVEEGEMGKAIGKKGINVKKIEGVLKKKIRLVEFSPDVLQFVRNLVYPLQIKEIKEEENVVVISAPDTSTRSLLIGRDRNNLNELIKTVKRYFEIEDVKVV